MKRVIGYKVIATSDAAMQEAIEWHLRRGWQPHGRPRYHKIGYTLYVYQAITLSEGGLREPTDEEKAEEEREAEVDRERMEWELEQMTKG